MKVLGMYIVETVNRVNGTHYPYWQEAYGVQDAVDKVRCYISSDEDIETVSKVCTGWK